MTIETAKIVSLTVNIICILFTLVLAIIYFKKEKAKNTETKVYSVLLAINIISLIVELIFYLLLSKGEENILLNITERLYYFSTCAWMFFFTIYTCSITKPFPNSALAKSSEKTKKSIVFISLFIYGIVLFQLPITRQYEKGIITTSSGLAPTVMFLCCMILLLINIILLIANRNKINKQKGLPMYLFMGLILIQLGLSSVGTQLLLITLNITLVSFLMYHTIENPDVKMLEEVSIAKEQAEKANTAKSEFLSSMSHEIRTPLNAIVGFSEMLKEDDIPDSSKEKVDDIITASQNLLELVNGILDISKIEANKLEIINKEYEPAEIFKELVSLTKARIGDKGLDFQVNIAEDIPSVLYGDNSRVKQIILNILTNAVKYTKEGYVMFNVSSIVKDNVCRLIISIEDSGIGIKQESIPKLFSKFERLNVEKQLTIEGTGLGLAITKKLLDLMNGTIIVQSIYGKGSKFTISLDQRIISMEPPLKKQKPKTESTIIDANGAKLLIVDDNEMNIKVAMTLLKKYHFNIDFTTSGLGCIAKLKENDYDIIFLDDMMPQMSGKETLKKLKENKSFKTPVIALTANAITGMKEEYLATGFDDYLSKPIERPELERIIKEFIMKDNQESINTDTSMATTSILANELTTEEPVEKEFKEVAITPPKEVLVIDNNVYTVKILEEILEQFNTNLTGVTTSKEAIENVIDKEYDIIFLDDSIVDKNYEKVMDDLTSISGFDTPVVLMTKHLESEIKDSIEKCGFKGFISKPINNIEVESIYASIVKQ